MLENFLKLKDIQILQKKEQLLIIKGGAHCTDEQDITQCHSDV